MRLTARTVTLVTLPLLAVGLLAGCSAQEGGNLKPLPSSSTSPEGSTPGTPSGVQAEPGSFDAALFDSIAKIEAEGFFEKQTQSEGGEPYVFAYDPALPAEKNAAIFVNADVAIPMPANHLGQKDGEGKGFLSLVLRDTKGLPAEKTDSGFIIARPDGGKYALNVKDGLITKVTLTDPASGTVVVEIAYTISKKDSARITAAHTQ